GGSGRDAGMPAFAPGRHLFPDPIDQLVIAEPVLGPFRLERQLGGLAPAVRDRNEVARLTSALPDHVRDPAVAGLEGPGRFSEGRVDDRVLDDYVSHSHLVSLSKRPHRLRWLAKPAAG